MLLVKRGRKVLGKSKKLGYSVYLEKETRDFFIANRGLARKVLKKYFLEGVVYDAFISSKKKGI